MPMHEITVVGSANYDVFLQQERLPWPGETLHATDVKLACGGKGANQAVQIAKLGVDVAFVGCVGNDVFGDLLRRQMEAYGVSTAHLHTKASATGLGIVQYQQNGQVHATIAAGANALLTCEEVERTDIWQSRGIVLQLESPVEVVRFILEEAKKRDIYTILNAAPAVQVSWEVLSRASCLVMNEVEATQFFGTPLNSVDLVAQAQAEIRARISGICIITLGAQGSVLIRARDGFHIPPAPDCQVVETTGAGDSYVGAFAVRKLLGDSDEAACQYAARAAECTLQAVGAQQAMPNAARVQLQLQRMPKPSLIPIV